MKKHSLISVPDWLFELHTSRRPVGTFSLSFLVATKSWVTSSDNLCVFF
jgi:hypothetical protein